MGQGHKVLTQVFLLVIMIILSHSDQKLTAVMVEWKYGAVAHELLLLTVVEIVIDKHGQIVIPILP